MSRLSDPMTHGVAESRIATEAHRAYLCDGRASCTPRVRRLVQRQLRLWGVDPQAVDRIALACSDILANVAPCARSSVLLWVDRRAYTVVLGVRYRGHCPGCPPDTRRGAEATSHEPEFGLRLLTCFVDHWEAATVRGRTTLEAFVRL